MFKGVGFIILSAYLVFLAFFHVLLRVFHVFILEYFPSFSKNDLLSYVVIKVELVCKLP